jgi:ecotin
MTQRYQTLLLAAWLPLTAMAGPEGDEMSPFPVPQPGFERMVFQVPPAENEVDLKVEILIGKVMPVDCNRSWFAGTLQEGTAQGWGYPYYVLPGAVGPASTKMACPPGEAKLDGFVPVQGNGFLRRYNSRLPVVVYVPQGFDVRYRIWTAGAQIGQARPR